jgi:hypothetical protein
MKDTPVHDRFRGGIQVAVYAGIGAYSRGNIVDYDTFSQLSEWHRARYIF